MSEPKTSRPDPDYQTVGTWRGKSGIRVELWTVSGYRWISAVCGPIRVSSRHRSWSAMRRSFTADAVIDGVLYRDDRALRAWIQDGTIVASLSGTPAAFWRTLDVLADEEEIDNDCED